MEFVFLVVPLMLLDNLLAKNRIYLMDENENHVIKHRAHFLLTTKPKKTQKTNIAVLFLMTNCLKSGVKFAIGLLARCQKPVPPMQTVSGRQEQQQS